MRTHAAVRDRRKEDLMIAEKIYAAFDEVSQRNTRPRKLIADRLIELAGSGAAFSCPSLLATAIDVFGELCLRSNTRGNTKFGNFFLSMPTDSPLLLFFSSTQSGPSRRMESLLAHIARKERHRVRVV